ncbi:MAG: molybdopterin-dependent oxidoreductase [Syntrophorhabdaceae bacterium]|nr:molybdopterin-dependent oxidoreductase [Syntrophorhabdaceae bacterium]
MSKGEDASIRRLIKAKIPGKETGIEIKKGLCSICNAQCGIDVYVKDGRLIKTEGTLENPVNKGRLCVKGVSNKQYVYHRERIRSPLLRVGEKGSDRFVPISWDEALDRIALRLNEIKEESGPESVVFFTGFPKWLRPFLKRLAHNFGSPNYMSESSTCYLATVLANRLTYGCSFVPDLKNTKCILNWSSNPYYSSAPQAINFVEALERGVKIIDVGPLNTTLSRQADIHLRIRPGTSGALALGIAHVIIEEDLYDREFVSNWTYGFEEYRAYVKEYTPEVTAKITGLAPQEIIAGARLYARTKPATIVTSASVTVHHTNGVQNHRAITALIGLTGNFDRPGGNHVVPTSYYHRATGFDTREEEFEQTKNWEEMAKRIGEEEYPVWSRFIHEAQAVSLPFQIMSGKPYPVRALVGFGVNYRMWPGSDFMKKSLERLEFFVDVDLFMTDTAKFADIVLPASSSLERSELSISPSRYAIWTEPVIPPVGDSRSDVDIIIELSKRLNLNDPLLSKGHEACLDFIFEPSNIRIEEIKKHPGGLILGGFPRTPYEKYKKTGFSTPTGKMEFASVILREAGYDPLPVYREPKYSPISTPHIAAMYPLILTTGARLPMYMHSRMYRVPWTRGLRPDPMVDINPKDGEERGIKQNERVVLSTPRGSIMVKANLTEYVPPGVVNMYHGFPGADVNELIEPDYRDPISGYPGYKSLLCDIRKSNGGDL